MNPAGGGRREWAEGIHHNIPVHMGPGSRNPNWSRSSGSVAKVASVTICAWVTNGATTCCMRSSQPSAQDKLDLTCAPDLDPELKPGDEGPGLRFCLPSKQ
jgi:hypothetical protein